MLIIKKRSGFQKWYQQNKERLSEKRRKLYAENPEYRERAKAASRKYRTGERPQPVAAVPDDAPICLNEAANRIGIAVSTLRGWRRKEISKGEKLLPEPKYYRGRPWFTEKQIELLKQLKLFFGKYKMRPPTLTQPILAELRASIFANWY